MLLLSVQIHSDLLQIEMLKVERVSFPVTVERSIVHQSDTLRNSSVADDRKVRQYVEELHRYLNVANRAPVRRPPPPKINWLTEPELQPQAAAAAAAVTPTQTPRRELQTPPSSTQPVRKKKKVKRKLQPARLQWAQYGRQR